MNTRTIRASTATFRPGTFRLHVESATPLRVELVREVPAGTHQIDITVPPGFIARVVPIGCSGLNVSITEMTEGTNESQETES